MAPPRELIGRPGSALTTLRVVAAQIGRRGSYRETAAYRRLGCLLLVLSPFQSGRAIPGTDSCVRAGQGRCAGGERCRPYSVPAAGTVITAGPGAGRREGGGEMPERGWTRGGAGGGPYQRTRDVPGRASANGIAKRV
jgi:hypothetical protein